MINRHINLNNYAKWLFEIAESIERRAELRDRVSRIECGLYLLSKRSISTRVKSPSETVKRLKVAWEGEKDGILKDVQKCDNAIRASDYANLDDLNRKGIHGFIPTSFERGEIEIERVGLLRQLSDELNDLLRYPTRPSDDIRESYINELEYKYLDFYEGRKLIVWLGESEPMFRRSVLFSFAYDLAKYDFVNETDRVPEKIENSVFRSLEYIELFKGLMVKMNYWSEEKGCKLTSKNAGSSKLSGVLLTLIDLEFFKDGIGRELCFQEMSKILGFKGRIAKNIYDPSYKAISTAKDECKRLYDESQK